MPINADAVSASLSNAAALCQVLGRVLPALLQSSGDLLTVKDAASGRYAYGNAAMLANLDCTLAQFRGSVDADWFDASVVAALRAADKTLIARDQPTRSDHSFSWQGQRREFSVLRSLVPADDESGAWLVSVWQDVEPQRRQSEQLKLALAQIEQQQLANEALRHELADQAMRDPATGLYRRAHFEDQLRREFDLSNREHREFAIVLIEIDAYSSQVQACGPNGHHRILDAMGRLLRGGTRAMDASCRYDERRFAVLLSGVGLATAHSRMEGLRRKSASQIVVLDGREMGFTVAVGVASFPHTANTLEGLMQSCEVALAEAKRRGGNHVTLAPIRFSDRS